MRAILFPGQGSQYVGMGSDFYKKFDIVKKIFSSVDETLGFSLSKIILEGPLEKLQLTQNTQPAIMTVGVSIYNVLNKEYGLNLNQSNFFAGHSLGEYTALVCSGSLTLENAAYLLNERGKFMQEAVPEGKGSMLAVMGIKLPELNKYISELKKENGVCEVANDNSNNQIIISGDKSAINEMSSILKKDKKKSIFLPVSAPFHCSLMKPAADRMEKKIQTTNFSDPFVELISNVTAKPTKNSEEIKKLLVEQIFSKVRWRETIEYMIKNDVNNFIEIGPGKVLSGLVKRINDKVLSKSINTIEDIESLK